MQFMIFKLSNYSLKAIIGEAKKKYFSPNLNFDFIYMIFNVINQFLL